MENELTKIFALRPTGLAYDSRRVQPGFVFFAVKGFQDDGHLYVRDAVQRGAVGVVVERPVAVPPPVGVVRVSNVRRALALAAARFYGHPAERLHMVGVTGTNGKTTTTHLISAVLRAQGKKAGLIGTLYNKIGDKIVPGERTTPESLDLQALLRRMVDEGVEAVAMEVSSHALALERVTGIEFDVAVFTNLTQDHLDFHHDLEDYFAAKARLFAALEEPGIKSRPKAAVLNIDDPYGRRLVSLSGGAVTYGIENPADVRARD
ncbi:MAG: UDP-N-acetylmuramyl-tripeptide synthetase, partial [Thermoanaerobacteraceae bacterium]|nr:UDP-N-acetylmuramyl-tripeptide synthetase [Thermoanaerobacteraceae bacterium]